MMYDADSMNREEMENIDSKTSHCTVTYSNKNLGKRNNTHQAAGEDGHNGKRMYLLIPEATPFSLISLNLSPSRNAYDLNPEDAEPARRVVIVRMIEVE